MELSKEQFSNEVKAKYSFDKNTFSHTPKDDDKDRIKAEIGDEKQEDFLPQVKIQRWDNECNFSARLIHEETTPIIETEGNKFKFTFGAANETFTFTAPTNPGTFQMIMVQDGTGSRTATWPATVKWAGGDAPTLSTAASSVDIVSFYWDGTSYYGVASLNFS